MPGLGYPQWTFVFIIKDIFCKCISSYIESQTDALIIYAAKLLIFSLK